MPNQGNGVSTLTSALEQPPQKVGETSESTSTQDVTSVEQHLPDLNDISDEESDDADGLWEHVLNDNFSPGSFTLRHDNLQRGFGIHIACKEAIGKPNEALKKVAALFCYSPLKRTYLIIDLITS